MENDDIISSENIMVNIEEISSTNKINMNNKNNEDEINNNGYIDIDNIFNNIKEKKDEQSTQNNYDIINTNDNIKVEISGINKNFDKGYKINFESPNKGVNLVKKGRLKISKNNLNIKLKKEEEIIKLYKLSDTLSNDIIFFFVDEESTKSNNLFNLGKYSVQI